MKLMGVDIGTTHVKAGLFEADGTVLSIASRTTITRATEQGTLYYDPDELWQTALEVIREAVAAADPGEIAAVGIASMSESGLLVDRRTGAARSFMVPWLDTSAAEQGRWLERQGDARELFCRTGIHASFKCSLAKVLWLREQGAALGGATWLSAADYVAYRLTGRMATDYSLAGRTYAFRIDEHAWDTIWLRQLGLESDLFPPALPSGMPIGRVGKDVASGLAEGTPVAVAGHDHVCAALATGATQPGLVLDSMGTAETLLGTLPKHRLGETEFRSGLYYGCHTARGRYYWMGSQSSSGGSVEWLLTQLGEKPVTYEEMESLLDQAREEPTDILYLPYLSGSRFPRPDTDIKAALIGLTASHGRADLVKAVLEGTAYEMETIRAIAEAVNGLSIRHVAAVGGGTRNRHWMQIKADVSGCHHDAWLLAEATLLGAALLAGIGVELYADEDAALAAVTPQAVLTFLPDADRHARYRVLYERGYQALQEPLREYYKNIRDQG